MFKIVKEKFGELTKIKIENSDTREYISIIPEFGGNVNEIALAKEGKIYSILNFMESAFNFFIFIKWKNSFELRSSPLNMPAC